MLGTTSRMLQATEDDQLGRICLLKIASAKCMNHLQSLQCFSKYTDINELQIFLLENKVCMICILFLRYMKFL